MKQTVNFSAFVDAFRAFDRYDQFGYDALKVLFNYLEELEADTGVEMELDVVAICCDYSVDNPVDIAESYGIDLVEDATNDEIYEIVVDWLSDNTIVCGTTPSGQIVYCSAF